MKLKDYLHTHDNNRQRCSVCGRCIPNDVERISFNYRTQWGGSSHRVCGLCILRLSNILDITSIEKWKDKLMIKDL